MQHIAIINSRQALRPTGASGWLQATSDAIRTLATDSNCVFIASLDEMTYEMTLYQLAQAGVTIEIILTKNQMKKCAEDEESLNRYLASEFKLQTKRTRILIIEDDETQKSNSSHIRDKAILQRADMIIPISIRSKGFWEAELSGAAHRSTKVDQRFRVPYKKIQTTIKQNYENHQIDLDTAAYLENYLIHWTRTSNHPWPSEKRWEFYRDLSNAQTSYPRSAFFTLQRILSEKRIRGSARHMPNSTAMVSLTAASLFESVSLMKYRARYREMTIEPFAIAIPHEFAVSVGARRIKYCSTTEMKSFSREEKLFTHSNGRTKLSDSEKSKVAAWEKEQEWRVLGDIDLKSVWSEIVVLTESQTQADEIEKVFGLKTLTVFA